MAELLTEWLVLREAVDAASRSTTLTHAIADRFARDQPLRILDLCTGTGSNVRYLAEVLPETQYWLIVDRNQALLAEGARLLSLWSAFQWFQCHIEAREYDVGTFDHPEIFSGRELVTASALLDLVSEGWLRSLAARCRSIRAPVLFALTYDGRWECRPGEPEDDQMRELFNRHQRNNDKGFGRAAGPDAVDVAERCFAAEGYRVRRAPSDWRLTPEHRDLQRHLIHGWAEAAEEIEPTQSRMIRGWLGRRLAHVEAGESHITVGHHDLAAWLE